MQSLTYTAGLEGPTPHLISVESSYTSGFVGLQLIGSSSEVCREGKERAKTALERTGIRFGHKRVLISLSPATLKKDGNHFDLPIAISLACLLREQDPYVKIHEWLFAAELGLDGSLRPTKAAVPMILCALQSGLKGVIVARSQDASTSIFAEHLSLREDFKILTFEHLNEVLQWVFDGTLEVVAKTEEAAEAYESLAPSFADMDLSPELETLALACAVGKHSLLLRGTPGTGKSMFAQRLPSLLPRMNQKSHFESLQIYSLVESILPRRLIQATAPYRSPHHSTSPQAILGTAFHPGELSLAHGGILFLDELPEFRRDILEALREPLENGHVEVSRAQAKVVWPADVQFLAACNNCPCGWYGSKRRLCSCSTQKLSHYWGKLSGPILDRIDIHFTMPEPRAPGQREPSHSKGEALMQELKDRRDKALAWAQSRMKNIGTQTNSALSMSEMHEASGLHTQAFHDIVRPLYDLQLSQRAILRVLRVARTLADLEASPKLQAQHLAQAVAWRPVKTPWGS